MKASFSHVDEFRVRGDNEFGSPIHSRWGAFQIPIKGTTQMFIVIADDGTGGDGVVPGTGWEHVSVRVLVDAAICANRVPTWAEMDWIKRLFWRDEEVVVQYHIHGADRVNIHSSVLHLWRPCDGKFPLPDPKMV